MDEDDDAQIDLQEFRNNYRLIVQELQKNKKLSKKQQKKDGGDFFRDRLHTIYKNDDVEKDEFLKVFVCECRKYQRIKKRKENEEIRSNLFERQMEI